MPKGLLGGFSLLTRHLSVQTSEAGDSDIVSNCRKLAPTKLDLGTGVRSWREPVGPREVAGERRPQRGTPWCGTGPEAERQKQLSVVLLFLFSYSQMPLAHSLRKKRKKEEKRGRRKVLRNDGSLNCGAGGRRASFGGRGGASAFQAAGGDRGDDSASWRRLFTPAPRSPRLPGRPPPPPRPAQPAAEQTARRGSGAQGPFSESLTR